MTCSLYGARADFTSTVVDAATLWGGGVRSAKALRHTCEECGCPSEFAEESARVTGEALR